MRLVLRLLGQYRSFVLYLVFGLGTTAVNMICYYLCSRMLHQGSIPSSLLAWAAAVAFAYITNRKWVFGSASAGARQVLEEMAAFFGCRVLTGILDLAVMFAGVSVLGFADLYIKALSNLVVILTNYAASKMVIFKQRNHQGKRPVSIKKAEEKASGFNKESSGESIWFNKENSGESVRAATGSRGRKDGCL